MVSLARPVHFLFGQVRGVVINQVFKATFSETKAKIKMSETGLPLQTVLELVRMIAPESLAASWDNVGLLVEPSEPVPISSIFLTNDLTEATLAEAIEHKANLILAYHPPIFSPLKTIKMDRWKERIVAKLLENRIALYSPHTAVDAAAGGLNDWLISAFHTTEKTSPIIPDSNNPAVGQGRIVTRDEAITLIEAVDLMKKGSGLKSFRVARDARNADQIKTIAVCAGSGASVLKEVPADLYITGEMGHHEALDAIHSGINVFLLGHGYSEQGYKDLLSGHLHDKLIQVPGGKDVQLISSVVDEDPLVIM